MRYLKNSVMAGATLVVAGWIGFTMQSTPAAQMRYGPDSAQTSAAPVQQVKPSYAETTRLLGTPALELTAVAYTSAPALRPLGSDIALPLRHHISDPLPVMAQLRDQAPGAATGPASPTQTDTRQDCDPVLVARPRAAAMALVELTAPCAPDQRVTLHHNGLMITESTDSDGKLVTQIPALSSNAVFMAAFDDGATAIARTEITSLDIYDRVVVQWSGPGEMFIHALEFGADYGDDGHIWAKVPKDVQRAVAGIGGFVSLHGKTMPDQDLRAQVYTFPSATTGQTGDIVLTVETEITEQTCGRRIEAKALQITGGGALSVRDLTLDVPDCTAKGDFLVLKNILQDLKIARN